MKRYDRQSSRGLHTGSKRWKQIRQQVLMEQPLCPVCQRTGKTYPAEHVDHIDGDSHNNSRDNLQGLCARHHSEKTRAEMDGREWRIKGHDARGLPLDPEHPWNR